MFGIIFAILFFLISYFVFPGDWAFPFGLFCGIASVTIPLIVKDRY